MFISSGVVAGLKKAAGNYGIPPQGSPSDQALVQQWRRLGLFIPPPPSGLAGFLDTLRAPITGPSKEDQGAYKWTIYNQVVAQGGTDAQARAAAVDAGRDLKAQISAAPVGAARASVSQELARHLAAAGSMARPAVNSKALTLPVSPTAPYDVESLPSASIPGGFLSTIPTPLKIGGVLLLAYIGYRAFVKRGPQAVQV